MRPRSLAEVAGQDHLLGPQSPLGRVIKGGHLHSMILWGPPGTGKTTLARLLANHGDAEMLTLSAVTSGVQDIRKAVAAAETIRESGGRTVLFVDEVHRFNKSQQDAFLPHIENGVIIFVGATTENPSFELNNALLSRARIYLLKPLDSSTIVTLIEGSMADVERGLGEYHLEIDDDALGALAEAAQGDARRALGFLETAADFAVANDIAPNRISLDLLKQVMLERTVQFDKQGDHFYDQISALHKSIRGSNPDAAAYWLQRMIQGGADPHYLLRRLARIASEDVGNADPRAMTICLDAWRIFDRLGSPEGDLAITQATIYLAVCAKSNAVYRAHKLASQAVRDFPDQPVPLHLRNAPTKLARGLGHGKGYRYAHDEENTFSAGQSYFPENMSEPVFYRPVEHGLEKKIGDKLDWLREQHANAKRGHE